MVDEEEILDEGVLVQGARVLEEEILDEGVLVQGARVLEEAILDEGVLEEDMVEVLGLGWEVLGAWVLQPHIRDFKVFK